MTAGAPTLGWGALGGAALAASLGSLPVQLAFAAVAIGLVGMVHGAGDLAVVARSRRPVFLAAYGLVSAICLWWWVTTPAVALPAFLVASAVHFGMEDAPQGPWWERALRGAGLVAAPATLHGPALLAMLAAASGGAAWLPMAVDGMALAGGIAAAGLLALAVRRHDVRLGIGTAAVLLLPPLIGFSLGFLILHALPQTRERQVELGLPTLGAYLRLTWPILAAAVAIAALVGILLLRWDGTGLRGLFAGIAALAMPHLLVTPWFEARLPVAWPALPSGSQRLRWQRTFLRNPRHPVGAS